MERATPRDARHRGSTATAYAKGGVRSPGCYAPRVALSDRDYMRDRVRRTIDADRGPGALFTWPPRPWLVITAVVVLVALVSVYIL